MRRLTIPHILFILVVVFSGLFACSPKVQQVTGEESLKASSVPSIKSIKVSDSSDRTQIIIKTEEARTYTSFTLSDPPRLIVDLPDISLGSFKDVIDINKGLVKEIYPIETDIPVRIARLDIRLIKKPAEHRIHREDGSLVVDILKGEEGEEVETEVSAVASPGVKIPPQEVSKEPAVSTPSGEVTLAKEETLRPGAEGTVEKIPPAGTSVSPPEEAETRAPVSEKSAQEEKVAMPPLKAEEKVSQVKKGPGVVEDIRVETGDGKTEVIISADRVIKVRTFRLKNRIVADVIGATHKLAKSRISVAESEVVSRVRIGLHRKPVRKVRVVLDLKKEAVYEVTPEGNEVKITVSPKEMAKVASSVIPEEKKGISEKEKVPLTGEGTPAGIAETVPEKEKVPPEKKEVVEEEKVSPEKEKVAIEEEKIPVEKAPGEVTEAVPEKGETPAGEKKIVEEDKVPPEEEKVATKEEVPEKKQSIPEKEKEAEEKEIAEQKSLSDKVSPAKEEAVAKKEAVTAKEGVSPKKELAVEKAVPHEGETVAAPPQVTRKKISPIQKTPKARTIPEVQKVKKVKAVQEAKAVQPARKEPSPSRYTGKRVSLDFQDADVVNVLRLIAEVSRLNIVIGDDVKGKITIKMLNVPWDQALDVILKMKGLGKIYENNVLRIDTLSNIAEQQEAEAKAKEAMVQAEDLATKIYPVNYADADEIEDALKKSLSSRGNITVDARTNTLIIKDIDGRQKEIASLLKTLDKPTPQVLIEARIVQADSNFARDLGIQWGGTYTSNPGNYNIGIVTGPSGTISAPTTGFAVNLPATGVAGTKGSLGFTIGKTVGDAFNLDLRLSAGEAKGLTKVLSAPKIATLDNREAVITQGESIPYKTVSQEGTKTEFIDATLTLRVTPKVTPDGHIAMKINITKNRQGSIVVEGTPSINKKEATTEVLVKDGETTVIGGIYEITDVDNVSAIPWFHKVPILGWLFKSTQRSKIKSELLIFITPKIIPLNTGE